MKFSVADVEKLIFGDTKLEYYSGANIDVSEEDDGIRVKVENHSWGPPAMEWVMKAALALKLDPSQLQTNSMELCDTYGEYADPYLGFDVTFLWEVPTGGTGE